MLAYVYKTKLEEVYQTFLLLPLREKIMETVHLLYNLFLLTS